MAMQASWRRWLAKGVEASGFTAVASSNGGGGVVSLELKAASRANFRRAS
ncbi:hypothetical protein GCM10009552_34600 [Rothia nasimurium]